MLHVNGAWDSRLTRWTVHQARQQAGEEAAAVATPERRRAELAAKKITAAMGLSPVSAGSRGARA